MFVSSEFYVVLIWNSSYVSLFAPLFQILFYSFCIFFNFLVELKASFVKQTQNNSILLIGGSCWLFLIHSSNSVQYSFLLPDFSILIFFFTFIDLLLFIG